MASAQSVAVSTLAGQPNSPQFQDGTGGNARFKNPQAVAVDAAGNLYIADTDNHAIRKVTPAGVVNTIAGDGTQGTANGSGSAAKFKYPEGIAVNSAGTKLWVADTFNHTIRAIDLTTNPATVSTPAGLAGTAGFADDATGPGTNARFNYPVGLAFDGTYLYIADQGNQNIRRMTVATGVVTTIAGPDGVLPANPVATSGYTDSATPASARFKNPFQLAVDNAKLYIADKGNNAIRVLTLASGNVATLAGSATSGSSDTSGPATSATFSGPGGVAVDSTGSTSATTMYVADSVNNTLRKVILSGASVGTVSTVAGVAGSAAFQDGAGTTARFNGLLGVAVNSSGIVYVADTLNQLVRAVGPTTAPVFTSAATKTFTYNVADTFTVSVTGSPAATFSVSSGQLPTGVTLTTNVGANTATLAGTPTTEGVFTFVILANNGAGSQTQSFTLTVQKAPVFTSTASTAFSVNTAGTFHVTATGTPTPTFSVIGTLPSSVAVLDSDGTLHAAPPSSTSGSPYTFTIRATNSAGTADQSFTLTIQNGAAISTQPENRVVLVGGSTSFSIVAGGNPAPTSYQWYRKVNGASDFVALTDGGNYSGSQTANLYVSSATLAMDQDQFQCVVSNGVGSPVTSQAGTLRVAVAPQFTSAATTTFVVNTAGLFQVTATGSPAPTFSITSGSLPSGVATLNSAGLLQAAPPSTTTGSPYVFTITATNIGGSVTQDFTLNVSATPLVPTVTSDPSAQTVGVGQNVTFTVSAAGSTPLYYQWQRFRLGDSDWLTLSDVGQYSGTSTATLTITGVSAEMNGDLYRAVVTNSLGSATSHTGQLTLTAGTLFSTVAGLPGTRGTADGTGSTARFNAPTSIAVDAGGTMYVADTANHVIRKVTSAGAVTTLAGLAGTAGSDDGYGTNARFNSPSGIAIDASGNLYVADAGNHTIRKIVSGGYVQTIAGLAGAMGLANGVGSQIRFTYPSGVAVDANGYVYVADTLNNRVRKLSPGGGTYTALDFTLKDSGGLPVSISYPNSIAINSSGVIVLADTRNNVIRTIGVDGTTSILAGTAGVSGSTDGTGAAARFSQPEGVAIDSTGNVYVADTSNHTIRQITSGGVVTTIAGAAGVSGATDGAPGTARFNQPYGVAVDSSGNVYVVDTFNHTVRRSGSGIAPSITSDPSSVSVRATQNATFTVTATGNPTPSYQWQRQAAGTSGFVNLVNGSSYSGVNSATLVVIGTTEAMSGDQFQVVVNNLVEPSATSATATLTVLPAASAPEITAQPANISVSRGESATFTVTATGSDPMGYQWKKDGVALAGATSATLTLQNVQPTDSGLYTVTITNVVGSVTSSPAGLNVNSVPVVVTSPRSQAASAGSTVTFSVYAVGSSGLTYQWRKNGTPIPAANSSTLSLPGVTASDAGNYDVVVTNTVGTATSSLAQLTVTTGNLAPVFTAQPAAQTALAGATITLNSAVSAVPAPSYQWRKDGVAIAGATGSTLMLSGIQASDAGNYDVVITNAAGTVTSKAATIRVIARSYAGTYFGSFGGGLGSFAMYVRRDNTGVFLGFIPASMSPVMSLNVLVDDNGQFSFTQATTAAAAATANTPRTAALAALSVSGTIGTDGNISGSLTGGVVQSFTAVRSADTGPTQNLAGLYLAGSSANAANLVTIAGAGNQAFAVVQSGSASDGGLGSISNTGTVGINTGRTTITETITASSGLVSGAVTGAVAGAFTGANETAVNDQRLANISTRARVSAGESMAIAGFVISGTESKPVLIRAVGPTLTSYGVSGALATPKLELYRGQTVIASNTGVGTATNQAAIAAAAVQAGAFALKDNADSAIFITLPPGAYTAQVSGGTNSGIALVEVYDLSAVATGEKIVNISTRGSAAAGDNAMIAGVVVTGLTPKRVLIRAVGPGLTPYGVSGVLAQPVLMLKTQAGALIAQNTGWSTSADAAAITTASASVGGFPLATADSALIVTLPPGAYSAQVTGTGTASGVALVEVYELQ